MPYSDPDTPTRARQVAELVAFAFVDGVWFANLMAARAVYDLSTLESPWLVEVATEVAESFNSPAERPDVVVPAILVRIEQLARKRRPTDPVIRWVAGLESGWSPPGLIRPVPTTMDERRWPVARIDSVGALAAKFQLEPNELAWYADLRSLEATVPTENLRHYSYRWLPKRNGGHRLLEEPKQNLKAFQRWILRDVLNHIPPHRAAHGFRQGRSIQSFVETHTAQQTVVRVDLTDFFGSVHFRRVAAIFGACGYPRPVAATLAGLTTNTTPDHILIHGRSERLRSPHLPQGAPTSPALSNLAAFGLDQRLMLLASSFEARYTRYADDMAFSGPSGFGRRIDRFMAVVEEIVEDEDFALNHRKTRVRSQSERQVLAGLVVNRHANVHRSDYDRLKAVLHDAAVNGPSVANRDGHPQFKAHLEGHIGFVQATNRQRAFRLWRLFDSIDWSE